MAIVIVKTRIRIVQVGLLNHSKSTSKIRIIRIYPRNKFASSENKALVYGIRLPLVEGWSF
jgi:hypothetical protein